jgi:hypothetical protein
VAEHSRLDVKDISVSSGARIRHFHDKPATYGFAAIDGNVNGSGEAEIPVRKLSRHGRVREHHSRTVAQIRANPPFGIWEQNIPRVGKRVSAARDGGHQGCSLRLPSVDGFPLMVYKPVDQVPENHNAISRFTFL